MEFLNSNKHIFTKKLLIENRKAFMKLQKEAIVKKWIKSGVLDELMYPEVKAQNPGAAAIDMPDDDDDELDIFL
tara:strand:+ start:5895 stop:6116 length:222 start_codon:yes stop_codon:yes gene_type:complete